MNKMASCTPILKFLYLYEYNLRNLKTPDLNPKVDLDKVYSSLLCSLLHSLDIDSKYLIYYQPFTITS